MGLFLGLLTHGPNHKSLSLCMGIKGRYVVSDMISYKNLLYILFNGENRYLKQRESIQLSYNIHVIM